MRVRLNVVLGSTVAIVIGFITLIGLLMNEQFGDLYLLVAALRIPDWALIFLQLAVITSALTLFVGIFNLLAVHLARLRRGAFIGRLNSLVLVLVFFTTLILYIRDRSLNLAPDASLSRLLLEDGQIASEAALAGLLFFTLVYGAMRLLRRGITLLRLIFVATVLVVLIGALPLPELQLVARFSAWLMVIPVDAGARGILIGIALATLLLGLRVLIGQDQAVTQD